MVTEGAKAVKNTKFSSSFSLQSNKDSLCLFLTLLNKIKTEINSSKEYSTISFSNNYDFCQILQKNITNNLIKLLLQKLIYVATVKLPTLEMISLYCSFSTQQQQNFYVHQLLFGLDFMILAHKRRNSQEMACWSFNHITVSNCLFLIIYF